MGAQHRLSEGVQLVRLERAEDIFVGLLCGAKPRPELPPPSRGQADTAAPPVARVVVISSGVAREGRSGATAYSTAKGALDGLLASLKWEAGAAGVLVNIVSPGFTVTENNLARFGDEVRESVRARTPSGRLSAPDDVARAVLLLGSPANGNVSGTYLPVAGGID